MGWLQPSCFVPILAAGAQVRPVAGMAEVGAVAAGGPRPLTRLTEQGTLLCPELGTG